MHIHLQPETHLGTAYRRTSRYFHIGQLGTLKMCNGRVCPTNYTTYGSCLGWTIIWAWPRSKVSCVYSSQIRLCWLPGPFLLFFFQYNQLLFCLLINSKLLYLFICLDGRTMTSIFSYLPSTNLMPSFTRSLIQSRIFAFYNCLSSLQANLITDTV